MKKRLLALLLCLTMLVSLMPTTALALDRKVTARDIAENEREHVQMSKMVSEHEDGDGNFDGTYDITLEAYANGYYKPVDVVLVVDQSGSMDSSSKSSNHLSNLVNLKSALNTFAETLKDVDKANRLTIIGFADEGRNGNSELFNGSQSTDYGVSTGTKVYAGQLDTKKAYYINGTFSNYVVVYDGSKWVYDTFIGTRTATPKTGDSDNSNSHKQFYEIYPTAAQYRSAAKSVSVNGEVNPEIKASINALVANGATYTDHGMSMALEALKAREDQTRDAIVVLFTDGYPGTGDKSGEETMRANRVIRCADAIKQTGAKIYTVGLGSGNDYDDMVTFLNNVNSGTGYYANTIDSAELPDIFSLVYKDIIGVNEDMTASAKLIETLSDKFELNYDSVNGQPEDAVTVKQLPYQDPALNGGESWGEAFDVDSNVTTVVDGKTITVSGYDYAKIVASGNGTNAVYYDSKGVYHGNKLRVVINVKPKDAEDPCWEGVKYGKLSVVPTELSQITDKSGEPIAAIKSEDSDFHNEFEVTLHHLLLTVADNTLVADSTERYGEDFDPSTGVTPATGYDVTAYQYTPAAGTDPDDYEGEFNPAETVVEFGGEDVTPRCIIDYAPGTLHLVPSDAYVVTVTGHTRTELYNGTEYSVSGYDVEVTVGGETVYDCFEDVDFQCDTTAEVAKTDSGTYPMGLSFSKIETSEKAIVFIINDGSLTINKRQIEMESEGAVKEYNGEPLTKNAPTDVTISGDGFVDGEGVDITVKGSQTEVGDSLNWYTYKFKSGTKASNYDVVAERQGTLTVLEPGSVLELDYFESFSKDGYQAAETKEILIHKTVTLDLDGGYYESDPDGWTKSGDDYTREVLGNIDLADESCNPKQDGYIFTGWSYEDDGEGNVTLTATWLADNDPVKGGDNVPDQYQIVTTLSISKGTWDGDDDADKTFVLTLLDEGGEWSTTGSAYLEEVPTGMEANQGYVTPGSWGDSEPSTSTELTADADYTYTFQPKDNTLSYPGAATGEDEYEDETATVTTENSVTLNLNGGEFDTGDDTALKADSWEDGTTGDPDNFITYTRTVNDDLDISAYIPEQTGYIFNGWAPEQENDGDSITLKAQWLADNDPDKGGDNIPDCYQQAVTFKVENGYWGAVGDTTEDAADKTEYVTLYADLTADPLVWSETGSGKLAADQIPTVGNLPKTGYTAGSWDTTPSVDTVINSTNHEFTYTYTVPQLPTGGGGGGAAPNTGIVPVYGDEKTIKVEATVTGKEAALNIDTSKLDTVIDEKVKTGTVVVDVTALNKDINTVTIPTEALKDIAKAAADSGNDVSGFEIKLTDGSVRFDVAALKSIVKQADGELVKLVIDDTDTKGLNNTQKVAVEKYNLLAVYDIYMTCNGKRITNFEGGKAEITVRHKLKDGEPTNDIVVLYVADDGNVSVMPHMVEGKEVVFTVTHFSNYVVAHGDIIDYSLCPRDETCPIEPFTDTKNDFWWHDGIHYCVENGLMKGTASQIFEPNSPLTRGMIVMILWRMEGSPVVNYAMSFEDVKPSEWYTEAIRWAQSTGVVLGYSDDAFGPNDNITREQLAAILYRYANYKGIDVSARSNLAQFTDAAKVSGWALENVKWAVAAGMVNGRTDTTIVPLGETTRAEAAAMIQRFCVNILGR